MTADKLAYRLHIVRNVAGTAVFMSLNKPTVTLIHNPIMCLGIFFILNKSFKFQMLLVRSDKVILLNIVRSIVS